jgi:hypothetical protein
VREAAWGTVSAGNLGETGNRGKEPAMRGLLRRLGLAAMLATVTFANTGCILNMYPADPNDRLSVLMFQSEDLRQLRNEWSRFWFTDMPSHLTPERVHGGIMP